MSKKILYQDKKFIIELLGIKIEKTYKNLLCGLPTKEINASILAGEIEDTVSFCESENIFHIEPTQTKIPLEMKYKLGTPYRLPDFVYKAKMICYQPVDLLDILDVTDSYFFGFGLLWFHHEFLTEIPQNISEYIIEKVNVQYKSTTT